jgi:type II secretory pathway component PulM
MITRSDDDQSVTTALSTLSARVAILERWMRRSQRHQAALIATVVIALVVCAWLLATR